MVAPLLDRIVPLRGKKDTAGAVEKDEGPQNPKHSNSVVVVDGEGNVVALTHTINTVIWGDTGMVVDGVPLPDSAGFQQKALAKINPGDRLPHPIAEKEKWLKSRYQSRAETSTDGRGFGTDRYGETRPSRQ